MQPLPSYSVRKASGPIAVDGRLQGRDWHDAERFELQKVLRQPGDHESLRARTMLAALWDERNLYLAFEVEDDEIWATLRDHDARLFAEECVEFFVDPDGLGRRYIETQINSLNTVRDLLVDGTVSAPGKAEYDVMARWHFNALRSAIEIRAGWGWILEVAVPWEEFSFSKRSFPPHPGDVMRVNFYRYERSRSGDKPLELSAWSEVANSFHEPQRFGRFVFV